MIRLKDLLTEAESANFTYVDSWAGKYIKFNSQKEMDAFREKTINNMVKVGTSKPAAARIFNSDYPTAKEWIADDEELNFGKIPDKYWPGATIPDPEKIKKLYLSLIVWKGNSDAKVANWLQQNISYLNSGKSKNPEIFKPDVPKGTPVYRAVGLSSDITAIIKKSNWQDWKRTEFKAGAGENDYWYIYSGKFSYNPHRAAQSWSTDPKVVWSQFYKPEDGVILTKRLDDEFYFSIKFLDWVSGGDFSDEREVIRIASKGADVSMMATSRTIKAAKNLEFTDSDLKKMHQRKAK